MSKPPSPTQFPHFPHQCDGYGLIGGIVGVYPPCPGCCACEKWSLRPWKRAGGGTLCSCGREYIDHRMESGLAYGFANDDPLNLYRLCDGSLVKL